MSSSEKRPKRATKKSTATSAAAPVESGVTAPAPVVPAAVEAAPAVAAASAPSAAVLTFAAGWQEVQRGALTAGGSVVVEYEPARLVEAPAAAVTAPVAEIVGYARFSPGGHVQRAQLVGRAAPARRSTRRTAPAVVAAPVAAEIVIPAEAEQVELWFEGTDAAGSRSWDSRFGANYRFEVVRQTTTA